MSWKRVALFGFVLWLVPFAASLALFGLRDGNRALFESLITVVGVWSASMAALIYFRSGAESGLGRGLVVGLAWAAISIAIDLPLFLAVFRMALADYVADIAVTYGAFPAITVAVAAARKSGEHRGGS